MPDVLNPVEFLNPIPSAAKFLVEALEYALTFGERSKKTTETKTPKHRLLPRDEFECRDSTEQCAHIHPRRQNSRSKVVNSNEKYD